MSQSVAFQGPVGLYTRLASRVLFPVQELLKQHSTVAVRRQLERSQYWTLPQLRALQLERLRALLVRAQAQSPYYREVMATIGLDPARDLHSLDDLRRLPLLDKPTIRAATAFAPPMRAGWRASTPAGRAASR